MFRLGLLLSILSMLVLLVSTVFQEKQIRSLVVNPETADELIRLTDEFKRSHAPLVRFSLANLPQASVDLELLDPDATQPDFTRYEPWMLRILQEARDHCRFPAVSLFANADLMKAYLWERFLCDERLMLSAGFFRTAPFMHPSGVSYVSLARQSGRGPFKDSKWLAQHAPYLHITEIPGLQNETDWNPIHGLIVNLTMDGVLALLSSQAAVWSTSVILLKEDPDQSVYQSRFPRYEAYARELWDQHLSSSLFITSDASARPGAVLVQGNMGWYIDRTRAYLFSGQVRAGNYIAILSLALGLSLMFLHVLRTRWREQEDRLFVLQTLTHELRTPATALKLHLENLRATYDHLPEVAQSHLLHLLEANSRLARVLEASTQYLKADQGEGPLRLRPIPVESMVDMIEEIIGNWESVQIKFTKETPDCGLSVDVYWLGICLGNLIENASRHGVPPVEVILRSQGHELQIEVRDQGQISLQQLKSGLRPFSRSEHSEGLGLGLTLVERIIRAMRGKLIILAHPTRFIVVLYRELGDNDAYSPAG